MSKETKQTTVNTFDVVQIARICQVGPGWRECDYETVPLGMCFILHNSAMQYNVNPLMNTYSHTFIISRMRLAYNGPAAVVAY